MLIGTSLSFCVKDIMEGRVKLDNVILIITGTNSKGKDSWEQILNTYSETYWRSNPEKGIEIANQLLFTGRIFQPRASNHEPLNHFEYWIEEKLVLPFTDCLQAMLDNLKYQGE
jgi:hypothetical protein